MVELKRLRRGKLRLLSLLIAVVAFVGALVVWKFWHGSSNEPGPTLLRKARLALESGEYREARTLAGQISNDDSLWDQAQLVAGEACMRDEEFECAIPHFQSLPRDGSAVSLDAALALGEIYRSIGELSKSEKEYRYILKYKPDHAKVHERLAYLMALTGRIWESRPHFFTLIQQDHYSLNTLAIFGDLERPLEQQEYLLKCAKQAPHDPLVLTGLAAYAFYLDGDAETARKLLEKVISQDPGLLGAQAIRGELLVHESNSAFEAWFAKLSPQAKDYPHIWYVRGLWARRQGNLPVAARCFWETLKRVPTHRSATYQLGQVMNLMGDASGPDFTLRANLLFELTKSLDKALRSQGRDEDSMRQIVELMEQTGRLWEACAWAILARQHFPDLTWPRTHISQLFPKLRADLPRTIDDLNLAKRHDLSRFPSEHAHNAPSVAGSQTPNSQAPPASIRFRQETGIGIDFVYENGGDPLTKGARMFEQTGGGVGVLDFDGDGWPDLYFTQGGDWPTGSARPSPSQHSADHIYRNLEGQRFIDITQLAGLGNRGFGQGVAVGDFDGDGFPDLYVANVGKNRLYQNNGDGTFTDVTRDAGLSLNDWTTSCVMADFNADGLPDLFDVNYVTASDVYTVICNGKACSPSNFDGIPDRLHINKGDGTFRWAKTATPNSVKDAKGLGVVAFDLHDRGRPSLFVANDQVPNYLLRNLDVQNADRVRLVNEGFLSGLGFNMNGLAMACMGVAADDANGDGRLDFFVTNFEEESNTLYIQDTSGLFHDGTNLAGLTTPSLPFVGWGTQFLDADLDGAPDLVVANGHVDDYRDQGGQYQMRAQFFHNLGEGQFEEVPSSDLGPYFQGKHSGRGLARLDWNRDGRMDFAVSHIGEPAGLLTNTTETVNHFLGVRLHATTTARDAIGSLVEIEVGNKRWTKQLVAGDGFQASNERLLLFGVGASDVISTVKVTWPSGATSLIKGVTADGVLEFVEGMQGTYWKGGQSRSVAVEHQSAQSSH